MTNELADWVSDGGPEYGTELKKCEICDREYKTTITTMTCREPKTKFTSEAHNCPGCDYNELYTPKSLERIASLEPIITFSGKEIKLDYSGIYDALKSYLGEERFSAIDGEKLKEIIESEIPSIQSLITNSQMLFHRIDLRGQEFTHLKEIRNLYSEKEKELSEKRSKRAGRLVDYIKANWLKKD